MRALRRTRTRRQPLLPVLLGVLAGAWLLVIAAQVSGHGAWFGHDVLGSSRLSSVALAVLAWELMTMAMMGPSCLPLARYVAYNTLHPLRTVPALLGGYLGAWTAFLVLFALADGEAHAWFGTPPDPRRAALVTGVTLALAAGWQLTWTKKRLLLACRTVDVLPADGRRADAAAIHLGLRQGAFCVGSCGLLMLAMMTAVYGRLELMIVVTVLAWLEKAARVARRFVRHSAAFLAALAAGYLAIGAVSPR